MAQVTATTHTHLSVPPAVALDALSDYTTVRPAILTDKYTDYSVVEGGIGSGTVVTWRLHATEKRVRHVLADVTVDGSEVVETDRHSTMVTRYAVTPDGSGSEVTVTTTWKGAGGIGGFFEKTFAPKGLARIHDELLANLASRLGGRA
ncbi:SRPBCC family protein [Nocardioides alkalitolerans]|uniref:SRPBCC family protein n=1 Tax=Nocardioides alkalitolerans TaxID=281714 RepID=UPI00042377CF|nr:SRPBCC family protein [Nocardioides alkalitolerans]